MWKQGEKREDRKKEKKERKKKRERKQSSGVNRGLFFRSSIGCVSVLHRRRCAVCCVSAYALCGKCYVFIFLLFFFE